MNDVDALTLQRPGAVHSHNPGWQRLVCLSVGALLVYAAGCATRSKPPLYQTAAPADRKREASIALNDDGLRHLEAGNLDAAERCFREALAHDLYNPIAHNNLGLVLLRKHNSYEAAWEFQYAAKLAPRAPEPRANLGLLLESVGRLEQATAEYEAALEIDPQNTEVMRRLARAYVKQDRDAPRLRDLLRKLTHGDHDEQWDHWIRGHLVRLGAAEVPGEGSGPPEGFQNGWEPQ